MENPFTPQTAEILKRIDTLLKKEDIDGAQAEVRLAKEVDPKNMYVHAYYERVQLLVDDRKRRKDADEAHHERRDEGNTDLRVEVAATVRAELKEAAESAAADRKKRLETEVRRKLEAESARKAVGSVPAHAAELMEYNKALFKAWELGVPGSETAARLEGLRSSLHITSEEHDSLAESVQRESYICAFKNLWMSASAAADGPSTITGLHRTFGITPGRFDGLDLTLLQEIRIPKTRPQLVVIDDDAHMLESIGSLLADQGFDVRPFITSDEAYRFLLHTTPDLILADINLESSTMGGFAFFQKLQEIPRLACLPFIFVSGLTDEVVMRTGKSLGADDYITKPFIGETLISIIRGKLRRYSELRSFRAN
jgi:CheY-like chemotaxis protein